jgi:hypothetical protein
MECNDLDLFIDFWSKLYTYPLAGTYDDIIHKTEYNDNDIQSLFIWKNGMILSEGKQKALDNKIKSKIKLINFYKYQEVIDVNGFMRDFNDVSAVWKIFLLHTIKPVQFPIYDQHIHRTYNYIHKLDYSNISASAITDKEKELFYFNTYLKFIRTLRNPNLKKLDEAFFAFGQFVNTKNHEKLIE